MQSLYLKILKKKYKCKKYNTIYVCNRKYGMYNPIRNFKTCAKSHTNNIRQLMMNQGLEVNFYKVKQGDFLWATYFCYNNA